MAAHDQQKAEAALSQLASAFTAIPFNQLIGMQLDHLSADHITMNFTMKNDLIGNFMHGILHGGVISSVLDMAGGVAAMAGAIHKYQDRPLEELLHVVANCSTIDLHVNFLSPGKGDTFIVKAWLLKSGQHISFTRMELFNQNDALIATGSGAYMIK